MNSHCGFGNELFWSSHFVVLKSQYHEGGYKFKARFDRCYLKGDALNLQHFRLIGNNPVRKEDNGGVGDYLSDHFGLLVRINVEAPTSTVQSGDD